MSDSNRSRYVAAGLAAIGLLLVTSGFGAFSYWIGHLSGNKEAETKHYQTEYAERTSERISSCFDGVDPSRECIEEAVRDNYQQQRAESDLNAQRNMADWAFWLLVISGAGLGVTAIGTCFLAWQVKLTREAVEDTENATQAMVEANGIAREAGFNQARAHLFPINVTIKNVAIGKRPKVINQFGNQGISFASDVTASTTFAFYPDDVGGENLIAPQLTQVSKGVVSPNVSQVIESENFNILTDAHWEKFEAGEANFMYFGYFKYVSLGQKCETHFRYICRYSSRKTDGTYSLVVANDGNWAT